jgi:hypothetical protein
MKKRSIDKNWDSPVVHSDAMFIFLFVTLNVCICVK